MYYDNQAAIYIDNNPTFHECTKHIDVDYHYITDTMMNGYISTPFTSSFEQFTYIFTKDLPSSRFEDLCNKPGMYDIYILQLEEEC